MSIALVLFARRHRLDWFRVHDYVACTVPIGLFFGRLANFVNGELWGKPSDVPWAIVFPRSHDGPARHPSQLFEATLEGLVLFAVLATLFWLTDSRRRRGTLVGAFLVGYGFARFIVEFVREPNAQLVEFAARTGLHMGQWLTMPMIGAGIYPIVAAPRQAHDTGEPPPGLPERLNLRARQPLRIRRAGITPAAPSIRSQNNDAEIPDHHCNHLAAKGGRLGPP